MSEVRRRIRIPTVAEYEHMSGHARQAVYHLLETIAQQADEAQDIWDGAEVVRQRAIIRHPEDTPRVCRERLQAAHAEVTTHHHRSAAA